jgi:hypothetical protein
MEIYKPRDSTLFNFCRAFFKKALGVLEQYIKAGASIPLITYYEPVPHINEDGKFESISYVPYEDQDFSYLILECTKALEGLPESKVACDYMTEKSYLLIGKSNFSPSILLKQALNHFLKNTGSMDYQEKEFLDIYMKIENLIFNNELLFRNTAKLENFSCSKDFIELDSSQFIRKYTQRECKEVYRHPSINIYDHTLPVPGDFKIEILTSKDKANWGEAGIEGTKEIQQVLTALRLFKDSAVGIATLEISEPITWFPFTGKACQLLPPHPTGDVCSIREHEIPELIDLRKTIKNINHGNLPPLEVAIKRFDYSHEHKKLEEALIDTMIGLEALYMKKEERDELRFKLALRVATFLEVSMPIYEGKKKAIFDAVYNAYQWRSKVVHGVKVPNAKIWECRIVKPYLSDSIKAFARLSQKHQHKHVVDKIDECIKSDSRENLRVLFS